MEGDVRILNSIIPLPGQESAIVKITVPPTPALFEVEIVKVEVHPRERRWLPDVQKRGRRGDWNMSYRELNAKPRLYVWAENFNVLEDIYSGTRYNRPERVLARTWKAVVEAIAKAPVALYWSQKAGCSCPCSPGFILSTASETLVRADVHITYRVKGEATHDAS